MSDRIEDLNQTERKHKRAQDKKNSAAYHARQEEITDLKQQFQELVVSVGMERATRIEWQSFLAHTCFQMYLFTRGNHEPVRFIFPSDGSPVVIHITQENFAEYTRLLAEWGKYYQPEDDDYSYAHRLHLLPKWVPVGTEICSLDQIKQFRKRAVELSAGINATATVDRGTFERYFLKVLASWDTAEQQNDPKLALRFPVPFERNEAYEEWRKEYFAKLQGKPAEPVKVTAAEIVKPTQPARICFVGDSITPCVFVSDTGKGQALVQHRQGEQWSFMKVDKAVLRFPDEALPEIKTDLNTVDAAIKQIYGE